MKFPKPVKNLVPVSILSTLSAPVAFAHPGHNAGEYLHGLLHVEHILALVAAGVLVFAGYALRKK